MKIRKFIIYLWAILSALTILNADEITYNFDTALQKIEKNQASILEYFLVCSQCGDNFGRNGEDGFDFRLALINKKDAKYLFLPESGTPYERTVYSEAVIYDKENGYIQIRGIDDERMVIYTIALFLRSDKTKIIGLTYYHEGGDGDTREYNFYEVSGINWRKITSNILPEFKISDFGIRKFEPTDKQFTEKAMGKNKKIELIEWEIVLPQYGTSLILKHHPGYYLSEGSPEQYDLYKEFTGNNFGMELIWDMNAGKFKKGNLLKSYE